MMDTAHFPMYLWNESTLSNTSYQELTNLVLQFPYCQNLRYLLLSKSILDGQQDTKKIIQITSTYSIDRPFLYQLIQNNQHRSTLESEISELDFLELASLAPQPIEIKPYQNALETSQQSATFQESAAQYPIADVFQSDNHDEDFPVILTENTAYPESEIIDFSNEAIQTDDSEQYSTPNIVSEPVLESNHLAVIEDIDLPEVEKSNVQEPIENNNTDIAAEDKSVISLDELFEGIDESDDLYDEEIMRFVADEATAKIISTENIVDEPITANFNDHSNANIIEFEIVQKSLPEPPLHEDIGIAGEDSFINWLKNKKNKGVGFEYRMAIDYQQINQRQIREEAEENIKRKDKKGYGLVAEVVEKSIAESEEVISETLAGILALQGQKSKAIHMFERLSLLYPEKSSYFALKINKIKNS